MAGTDGSSDNEEREEERVDESVLPPGPRRSTYTPPTFTAAPTPSPSDSVDDDVLASAMAEDLKASTGTINVIYQLDDVSPQVPLGVPVEPLPASPAGARILPADPDSPLFANQRAPMPAPDENSIPVDLPPPATESPLSQSPAPPEFADSAPIAPPEFGDAEPVAPPEFAPAPPAASPEFGEAAPGFVAAPEYDTAPREFADAVPVDRPSFAEPASPASAYSEPAFEPDDETAAPAGTVFDLGIDSAEPTAEAFTAEPFSAQPADARATTVSSHSPEPETAPEPEQAPEPAPEPVYEPPTLDLPPPPAAEELDEATMLARQSAPAGKPWVPERRSLRDEDLSVLLDAAADHPDGTLGAMEELERQMQLRSIEAQEFREWQESMNAVGTPEALAAVQRVIPDFTDLLAADEVPAQPAPRAGSFADAPPPSFEASRSDAPPPVIDAPPPVFDAPPPVFDAPPPMFDAPPPSFDTPRSDAPPPVVEELPPLFDAPPPMVDAAPPIVDAPPPVIDEFPVFASASEPEAEPEAAPALVDPPEIPEAWDIPAGSPLDDDEPVQLGAPILIEPGQQQPPALVEPDPFAFAPLSGAPATGSIPLTTGSIPVVTGTVDIPQITLDLDVDDDVDATDQVGFDDLLGGGPNPGTAPVEPIRSPRIPDDEVILQNDDPEPRAVGFVERVTLEPTLEDERVGRAARMFWLWFAPNGSIVSVAFGAMLFSLGMSLRQAIVGVLAGIAISFIPLGLGTLAGKRSGQPTMVVSRAAFGTAGNVVPAVVAVLGRVFWSAVLLWILATATAAILQGAQLTAGLSTDLIAYAALGIALAIAVLFAVFGYRLIAIVQLVVAIAAAVLVAGFIALTYSYVDVSVALTHPDGSWLLAGTAAVLVFSFVGLLWANSSGDLARYQRPGSSGGGAMLATTFGAAIPAFVLISYGALLAASSPQIATGLIDNPFDTLGRLLPLWYPAPLIAAVALSLISAVIVTLYSGAFSLVAVGVRLPRVAAVGVMAVLVVLGAVALLLVSADLTMVFRDLATTLAVPVAAWAGIFAADTMIRNRRYHSASLVRGGGIYPVVNWVNLVLFLVITALGYGLTTATVGGLSWEGYLFPLLGVSPTGELAGTDIGVLVALLLGLVVPIVTGIPRIRRQESASVTAN